MYNTTQNVICTKLSIKPKTSSNPYDKVIIKVRCLYKLFSVLSIKLLVSSTRASINIIIYDIIKMIMQLNLERTKYFIAKRTAIIKKLNKCNNVLLAGMITSRITSQWNIKNSKQNGLPQHI